MWTEEQIEKELKSNPDYAQFFDEYEGRHYLVYSIGNIPVIIYRLSGGVYESFLGPICAYIDTNNICYAKDFAIKSVDFIRRNAK